MLAADPCDPRLGAYRLSGPLEANRLPPAPADGVPTCVSTPPSIAEEDTRTPVVVLIIGERQPGHRSAQRLLGSVGAACEHVLGRLHRAPLLRRVGQAVGDALDVVLQGTKRYVHGGKLADQFLHRLVEMGLAAL